MSHIEDLLVRSSPEFFDMSRNPAIFDLQLLQLSAEHEDDPRAQDRLYEQNLPLAARPILGRTFLVDASLAVGIGEMSDSPRHLVFGYGLKFYAEATEVGYVRNLAVPTDSAGIGFEAPRVVVEDQNDDWELAQRLSVSEEERIELSYAWIPIKALRRCAVQKVHTTKPDRFRDDYLAKSIACQLEELGMTKAITNLTQPE